MFPGFLVSTSGWVLAVAYEKRTRKRARCVVVGSGEITSLILDVLDWRRLLESPMFIFIK